MIKQKIMGILFIILSILVVIIGEGDATLCLLTVPFGMWLLFTKKYVLYERED